MAGRYLKSLISRLETNDKIVLGQTAYAFLIKGAAFIVSFIATPLYIKFFSDNSLLGVWFTVLSVVSWTLNFDLGIGNGIRNHLVEDLTNNNRVHARETISSGFISLAALSVVICLIGFVVLSLINVNGLFHIPIETVSEETLKRTTLYAFLAIVIRFFLTSVNSVFYALQKSSVNSLLALIVSILQLLVVVVFRFEDKEYALRFLSSSFIITSNLPVIIAGVLVFSTSLKDCRPSVKYISEESIHGIIHIGVLFFACQILFMFLMNTNEYLITYCYGADSTYEYSLYNKILSVVSMLVALAMTPVWSVITKAATEKDLFWIKKFIRRFTFIMFGVLLAYILLVSFLQPLMDVWLRDETITVSFSKSLPLALFGFIYSYSSMLSAVACGLGKIKVQFCIYITGLIIKLVAVFIFASHFASWSFVIWINVAVFAVYCIVQRIAFNYLKLS